MGLLTCARCGCTMTAELKKGKYGYYRCTGFRGRCGDTYIREERLSELLGTTVRAIQIPLGMAEDIATVLQDTDGRAEQERLDSIRRLEDRRRRVLAKIDRDTTTTSRGVSLEETKLEIWRREWESHESFFVL